MGSLTNLKLCSTMAEYTNQTCMGANATCATTTLKANETGEAMAYVLGCVEVRTKIAQTNCNLFVYEIFRS